MHRRVVPVAFLVLAFVLPAWAPAAARADDTRGDLINAVAIMQPLAHAQDLLRLPGLSRVLDSVGKTSGGTPPLAELQMGLAATAPFWPRELTIGMPTSGFTQLGGLGRVFTLTALCKGATGAGARAKKELPQLQKALAAELRAMRLPPIVVSASFADAATARQVADAIRDGVRGELAAAAVALLTEGDAFGVRLRLGRFFPPTQMKAMLREFEWVSGPRDPQTKALGAAVAALEVEAWVALEGKNVVLTVGPRQPGRSAIIPPPPPGRLGAGSLLVAAHSEIAPLRAIVADWRALWAKWENTAAGARTRADDDTDLIGDLPRIARTLDQWGDRSDGWLWTDRGLHGFYRLQGAPPSAALASEPVAALVPADAAAVDLDARDNLGDRLSNAFERVEDRLARRSFAESLRGEESGKAERTELAYYKSFARLRALVHDTGPRLFKGGSALIVGRGARIGRLEVRHKAGAPAQISTNVAVPELAWVGRAADPNAALAFVGDFWAAFAAAAASATSGRTQPPPRPATLTDAPAPLAGATARWLDTSWFDALIGEQLASDGGFKPQVAVRGDTVVLSTSPALAQQILSLAAGAPAKDRMALPPSGASGGSKAPLTAWARYPCAPLAAQLRSALAAAAVLAEHAFDPISTKSFGDLGATVCQVIDGVTMTTVAEGGVASTTLDVPAAAALYKK